MGQLFDRQNCSEKCESLILHFNYSKIVISGWFLISFIDVSERNAKPLKLLLEGDGEIVRSGFADTCMTCKCATRSGRV